MHRKLNRSKGRFLTKQALTKAELKTLLAWLQDDRSIKGLENYAIVLTLASCGLRASELSQLNWGDLYCEDGRYTAYFTGKGGRAAEQEIYAASVAAAEAYFQAQFRRTPDPGDRFFYTLENYKGRKPTPLKMTTLWACIREIGFSATKAGVITRELEFSPHLFRRTFATLYYRETRDLKATQLATRHASVDVLMKHYMDSAQGISEVVSKILA